MTANLRHLIDSIASRVNLGWATPAECDELKRLLAEQKRQLDFHFQTMEELHRSILKPMKTDPSWIRAMGMEDYIHHRRMCQERESFEEQRERVNRM
jgi:hypothetical protein